MDNATTSNSKSKNDTILAMYQNKCTRKIIAETLNLNIYQVNKVIDAYCKENGIAPKVYPKSIINYEKVCNLYHSGATRDEIVEQTGLSLHRVKRLITRCRKENDIFCRNTKKKQNYCGNAYEILKKMYDNKASRDEIAKKTGLTASMVKTLITKYRNEKKGEKK